MLGVLDDYVGLCKYNVNTLAMTDEERAAMLKDSQEKAAAGSKARPPTKPTETKAEEAKTEEMSAMLSNAAAAIERGMAVLQVGRDASKFQSNSARAACYILLGSHVSGDG